MNFTIKSIIPPFFRQHNQLLLWGLWITLGVTVGLGIGAHRFWTEWHEHDVVMAIPETELNQLAIWTHKSVDMMIPEIKKTLPKFAIIAEEQNFDNLETTGKIAMIDAKSLAAMNFFDSPTTFAKFRLSPSQLAGKTLIQSPDSTRIDQIVTHLTLQLGPLATTRMGPSTVIVNYPKIDLLPLGIGFNHEKIAHWQSSDVGIILRLAKIPNMTHSVLAAKLNPLPHSIHNRYPVLIQGDTIPGYPNRLHEVSDFFRSHQLKLGLIEFTKQLGATQLASLVNPEVIPVHSITEGEMLTMSPARATLRYRRAVVERKVPLIVLHIYHTPPAATDATISQVNLDYFARIRSSIEKTGYHLSTSANRFSSWKDPGILAVTLTIGGIWAFIGYWITQRRGKFMPKYAAIYIPIIGLISTATSCFVGFQLPWIALNSLILVSATPVIAIDRFQTTMSTLTWQHMQSGLLRMIGTMLVGIVLLLPLISTTQHMLNITPFFGVKFAILIPLIAIGLLTASPEFNRQTICHWMTRCIQWGALIGLTVMIGGIGIYLIRSGNASRESISPLETTFRNGLESIFWVRPRTKEFLIAYPIFLMGFWILPKNFKWISCVIGGIGLASVMNSFCHAHTPLLVSGTRALLGLILGVFIGYSGIALYKLGRIQWTRH